METTTRQYGMWPSPITPKSLADDRRLEAARFDADGQTLVWLEGRSGHGMLLCQRPGGDAPRELVPDLSVRGEVGYGGGDFCVAGGFAYFVVQRTGRLWRVRLSGGQARPVTPPFGKAAAPVVSPDGAWVVYVHHDDQGNDRIAVVDAEGRQWPQILVAGHDFFMQPRFSPDGRSLAWIAWDHPNMPWDGTTLYLASLQFDDDRPPRIGAPRAVAGGEQTSIFQPEFTPDGRRLLYVSDETGWGRIAVHELDTGNRRWLTARDRRAERPGVCPHRADRSGVGRADGGRGVERLYRRPADRGLAARGADCVRRQFADPSAAGDRARLRDGQDADRRPLVGRNGPARGPRLLRGDLLEDRRA
jgi:hypothetical protein